jgi:hypothetical protein
MRDGHMYGHIVVAPSRIGAAVCGALQQALVQ